MATKITFSSTEWNEIKRKMVKGARKIKDVKAYKRLLALHMRGLGRSNKEIAEALGFSSQYITELVSKFRRQGMEAVLTDNRTSNNRRMSFDEEAKFLSQFVELAESAQIVTVAGILKEFEKATGKKSNTQTIYKLLKRHGWRKVNPRPRHPGKASDEEIASSKKLTKNSKRSYWKK